MLSYILRRLVLMIPTLIGMSLLLFCMVRFAPGITARGMTTAGGEMKSDQDRAKLQEALEKRLHLRDEHGNKIPIPKQYALWLADTVRGNLGVSAQYNKPVAELIRDRLPVTLSLNILAALVVYCLAIPGGILSSATRGKSFDMVWSFATLAFYSLPTIWIGSLLIGFLANPQYPHFHLFPSAGLHATNVDDLTFFSYVRDFLLHIFLPVLCLSYGGLAYLSKQMRASMLENLSMDYARTARAKGLRGSTVVLRHVFRNSLLPLITIASSLLPGMLGGSVIIERIFSIQGMGDLTFTATFGRDLPVIQGVALIASVLTLISLLLADLCYAFADPRVSYD